MPISLGHFYLVALLIFSTGPVLAAPASKLVDAHWEVNDPQSVRVLDHTKWDQFIKTYSVKSKDGIVRIRYGAVTAEDRTILDNYVEGLQTEVVSSFRRNEQRALWINLYNAVTIKLVLDYYPLKSIRDVKPGGWFSPSPWDHPLMLVESRPLTLNDIEHGILRPIWQDARLHYALNCVSLGCPDIAREAYSADNTEQLLEAGARQYINHSRGVRVEGGTLTVSKIYKWYRADFGGDDAAIIAHIRRYAAPPLARQLQGIRQISQYEYIWLLNDAE